MIKNACVLLLLAVGVTACDVQPQTGDLARYMVVQTQYDQEVIDLNNSINRFDNYSTFVMRIDTLGYVYNARPNDTLIVTNYAKSVSRLVRDSFLERGYSWVTQDEEPDFAVNIVVLQNFSYYQSIFFPSFYSGYYYGYWGYYGPIVTNHYSNYATLVIEVIDIKNATNNQYKWVWKAFIGDLVTTIDLEAKTLEAIATAFQQSPYI
jgi:hypothetical protein